MVVLLANRDSHYCVCKNSVTSTWAYVSPARRDTIPQWFGLVSHVRLHIMSPIYREISMGFYVFSCFPYVCLVSSCNSMFFPDSRCFPLFFYVFTWFSLFSRVFLCFTLILSVFPCFPMFLLDSPCFPLFFYVSPCFPLFFYVSPWFPMHCQKLGTRWRLRVRTKATMPANSYKKMYGDKETFSNISIMSSRVFGARLETC